MGLLFSVREKALGYHSQNTALFPVCAVNWLYKSEELAVITAAEKYFFLLANVLIRMLAV